VKGGVSGGTNSSREEFAKNTSSATEKHAQSASAKRDITVNTSSQQTVSTGEETLVEREIENINVGHTLNFVFRQLNQEYISLLSSVDVRVSFFNGYPEKTKEVALHDLDELLQYCVAKPEHRDAIRRDIYFALSNIRNYEGRFEGILKEEEYPEQDRTKPSRIRAVDAARKSVYDPGGKAIVTDGIILSARKVVLRTDGVIVEALVGASPAIDEYSRGLQDEKVKQQRWTSALMGLEAEERQARLEILKAKDVERAALYKEMFSETAPDAAAE
jgi:hypothetical protein